MSDPDFDLDNTAWTIKIPDAAPSPAAVSKIFTQLHVCSCWRPIGSRHCNSNIVANKYSANPSLQDLDSDNTSWHIGARTAPTPAAIDNSTWIFQQWTSDPETDLGNTAWTIKIPDAAPSPAAASDIITQVMICSC